jgi:CheY-like chemotaxis protein
VLVVDDDAEALEVLDLVLGEVPAQGVPVVNCAAARSAAAAEPGGGFRVAVVDVNLPDGDGLALAAELRGRSPACRIVVVSGYPEPEGGPPKGVDLWLTKPVDPSALRGILRILTAGRG